MSEFMTLEKTQEAADAVRQRVTIAPRLSGVADAVDADAIIPYAEIPHIPPAAVEGHVGRLVVGRLQGQNVMVMQGRTHYYEGHSMAEITLMVRVMQLMDVEMLIVTNAAGGINPGFTPGDVMIIHDHINLIGMAGLNPLRGPNLERFGPRFPDMSQAYDPELRTLARQVAVEQKIPFHEGVYICLAGPSFETAADIRFLRTIGADAVGMSTVPEVTVARHGRTRVLGLSGISNVFGAATQETTHEEVLEAGRLLVPRMEAIIKGTLQRV